MNPPPPPPALLSAAPPCSSQHSLLASPFHFRPLSRRRRFKVFLPRNFSTSTSSDHSLSSGAIFGGSKDLTGIQPLIENISPPPIIRLATSAIVLAGAIAAGYGLGLRFGKTRNAALGGGALVGAAAGAAISAVNSAVPEVAAVRLHNYVAGCDDLAAVNKEDIESIAKKYGVSKQDEAFNSELCDLYCCYVSYVLPSPGEYLKGDEADTIIGFKNALGIDDPDAAAVHMEIGRRIFRRRLETDRRHGGDVEQRWAFQNLVYVSTLVFGEASSFLLPWKRVFKVTDAQVEIAIRENAKRLYANMLLVGRDVDPKQLIALREAQLKYRLSDEIAEDLFRKHTRKVVEGNISTALSILKSNRRAVGGYKQAVGELDRILAFNTLLVSLRDNHDADLFARGVGPVSLVGGEYDIERKTDDLKLLYRAYLSDSLAGGRMEDNKLAALSQLRNLLGLGEREAEAITLDLTSKVYQKRLSEAIQDGKLEMADRKAAFLQNLCDELHFDMEKASNIHEDMYRKKLLQCVADGELDDEEFSALLRLRLMLSIPQQTVDAAHAEICGSLYETVVKDAIAAGVNGFCEFREDVKKAGHGLRLTREVTMPIISKAVRKIFLFYIKLAQSAKGQLESVTELKKMMAFNSCVATKLVADFKGEASDSPSEESVRIESPKLDREDEWEELHTLNKIRPDKELPDQTEITLKEDISEEDRMSLYRTYLEFYCAEKVEAFPSGAITIPRDELEFVMLGRILGLTENEINNVHRSLDEKALMKQAEVPFGDGQLTEARIDQPSELQKKVGLPSEYSQKFKESITRNEIAAATGRGNLNIIKQIRELKESGVDLDSIFPQRMREMLFEKTVNQIFSSGTGEFDEEEFYRISSALDINAEEAKGVVHDIAQSKLKYYLIQAVSQLRQGKNQPVVSSLNDLLVCDKVVASEELSWDVPKEVADLFGLYARSNPDPQKLARLQSLLGISDSRAAALRYGDGNGNGMLLVREEENYVL